MNEVMNTNIESVGTVQVIYTVESNPDDDSRAIVTYWLTGGQKIGSMDVPKRN